jgi:hypothetical protein
MEAGQFESSDSIVEIAFLLAMRAFRPVATGLDEDKPPSLGIRSQRAKTDDRRTTLSLFRHKRLIDAPGWLRTIAVATTIRDLVGTESDGQIRGTGGGLLLRSEPLCEEVAMTSTGFLARIAKHLIPQIDAAACIQCSPEYECIQGTCTLDGQEYPYGYFYVYYNCECKPFYELLGCCT